jgi:hypothetical protein
VPSQSQPARGPSRRRAGRLDPEQPWQAAPSGWTVAGELQRWRIQADVIAAELHVSASAPSSDPAVWVVTG